jgi:hypothetical protein
VPTRTAPRQPALRMLAWYSVRQAEISSVAAPNHQIPLTSTSTRRSGCRQAINVLLGLFPVQTSSRVTGAFSRSSSGMRYYSKAYWRHSASSSKSSRRGSGCASLSPGWLRTGVDLHHRLPSPTVGREPEANTARTGCNRIRRSKAAKRVGQGLASAFAMTLRNADPQATGTVPPSMTYSTPWMDAARSDTRNPTSSATSRGLAGRPMGMPPNEAMSDFSAAS